MIAASHDMLDLGRKQAQLFLSDNLTYCEFLVCCDCPRAILVMAYFRLVKERKLTAIEDMLLSEKETAWQTAKDIAQGRLGRRPLVEVVKALLVIEYFLKL